MKKIYLQEQSLKLLIEAMSLDDIYKKYYSSISSEDFDKIVQADPTWNSEKPKKMGKYTKWLFRLYTSNKLKIEDLYKAREYLDYFNRYKQRLELKDIGQYSSLQSLYLAIRPFMENSRQPTSHKDEIRQIKEGAEKVYEDDKWLIVVPHTQEASCYYGKGTEWCTAANKSYNLFDDYNEEGPLYININKTNNKKYQFHFETESFMDETDAEIAHPIAKTIGLSEGAQKWYLDNVSQSSLIFKKIIPLLCGDDENDAYFYISYNMFTDTYQLYYEGKPMGNTIAPLSREEHYYECKTLFYDHYGLFDNTNGKMTLVLINKDYEVVLYSETIDEAEVITNREIYLDGSILRVINNGEYQIVSTEEGKDIFSVKNPAMILDTQHVASRDKCLTIYNNGKAILYDGDVETDVFDIDKNMLNKQICYTESDSDDIFVRVSQNKTLVFNGWTLELEQEITDD